MPTNFQSVINQLVEEIDGVQISLGSLMESLGHLTRFNDFLLSKFLERKGELIDVKPNGERGYRIRPADFGSLRRLERRCKSVSTTQSLLPESLLVTVVSRYDAFLGRLIRQMYLSQPELLNSSERTLTFSSLLKFGDFERAREYLIEKEVESQLRKSHTDQFSWLEEKLGIPLRNDLPSWPTFIELTERRNLFVHADGTVSYTYLENCKKHGVAIEQCNVGERLEVSPDYYRTACECIIEIAVKLTHVVWRKLLPDDREAADDALTRTCFDLLVHEKYALAAEILRFANALPKKHSTERHRLIFLVNLAQSYKWLGKKDGCLNLLQKEDWSAKGLEFRICAAVLQEQFEEAVRFMKEMGKDGPIKAENYREWPVFREARKNKPFLDAYRDVFGVEMQLGESLTPVTKEDVSAFLENLYQPKAGSDNSSEIFIRISDVPNPSSVNSSPISQSSGSLTSNSAPPPSTPEPVEHKVGRNQPCTCGSGKKFKNCCMRKAG